MYAIELRAWAVHGLAVVLWAPGGGVDVDVVGVEGERLGLDGVVDHAVQHPDPSDAGVVGHPHPADAVVGLGGHLPRAPRPVLVVAVVLGGNSIRLKNRPKIGPKN